MATVVALPNQCSNINTIHQLKTQLKNCYHSVRQITVLVHMHGIWSSTKTKHVQKLLKHIQNLYDMRAFIHDRYLCDNQFKVV